MAVQSQPLVGLGGSAGPGPGRLVANGPPGKFARSGLSPAVGRPAEAAAVGLVRSSRTASARTRVPMPTITAISSTPPAGEVTISRLTRGRCAVASIGPSWPILLRACSVVHGAIWLGGRDPARVSASTWANWLGQCADGSRAGGRGSVARVPGAGTRTARVRTVRLVRTERLAGGRRATLAGRSSSYGGAVRGTVIAWMATASGNGRS